MKERGMINIYQFKDEIIRPALKRLGAAYEGQGQKSCCWAQHWQNPA